MYYHGTTTNANIDYMLLPPTCTSVISEKGRNKNLDRIFFTKDIGLAKIYAGRACSSMGGEPIILRVINPVDIKCLSSQSGATVYHADWAFCETIN